MIWSLSQASNSPVKKFLVGEGDVKEENLDKLQNENLAFELKHASPIQKLLIYSAIKFYLNKFYEGAQSKKFEELNIKGVEYDEIENAPDVRLAEKSVTSCQVFQTSIFNSMLFNFFVFSRNDKNEWLNEIIDLEKQKKDFHYTLEEKILISSIIYLEPDLLSEVISIEISGEVKDRAKKNVLQNKPEYLSSLLSKEFNQIEIKKPLESLEILTDMAAKLSDASKEKVNDYSDDSLAKLKNTIFSELKVEDKIQVYQQVYTNCHEDEVLPLGDLLVS